MAEGHAVHGMAARVRRLVDQPGRSQGPVTEQFDPRALDGRAVAGAEAHGKHLLIHLHGTDLSPHLHLGMHGAVSVRQHRRALGPDDLPRTDPPDPAGLAWRHLTATHLLEVTRPTVCELLDADGRAALHARLGPDPLRDDADPAEAIARLHASRRAIGALLVDQSVVSGIGNVYRAELLWRAGLDPHTPGNALDPDTLRALWDDAFDLMTIGLGAGWIVAHPTQLADARALLARGEAVPRWPKRYAVYLRRGEPCPRCGTPVASERLGLQTMYWCPGCQQQPA
ncbi:Fpg/Nei family DNA glycosylase [Propioniciclava soli]|uniref:DNA-(apurinic or apyrimidinic site) lyase n=1 Tax=Propioniciclava soli TaxID=2775081 RepID=A0ABZ3C4L3_9ACTN